MSKYTFSPNAIVSLKDIEKYSSDNFGKIKTGIYLRELHEKIELVAKKPKNGKLRNEIFNEWDCYSYFVNSHTIYYEIVSDDEINIIDILHQSMEPKQHLLDN
jgi:toxin ParE1/3/4